MPPSSSQFRLPNAIAFRPKHHEKGRIHPKLVSGKKRCHLCHRSFLSHSWLWSTCQPLNHPPYITFGPCKAPRMDSLSSFFHSRSSSATEHPPASNPQARPPAAMMPQMQVCGHVCSDSRPLHLLWELVCTRPRFTQQDALSLAADCDCSVDDSTTTNPRLLLLLLQGDPTFLYGGYGYRPPTFGYAWLGGASQPTSFCQLPPASRVPSTSSPKALSKYVVRCMLRVLHAWRAFSSVAAVQQHAVGRPQVLSVLTLAPVLPVRCVVLLLFVSFRLFVRHPAGLCQHQTCRTQQQCSRCSPSQHHRRSRCSRSTTMPRRCMAHPRCRITKKWGTCHHTCPALLRVCLLPTHPAARAHPHHPGARQPYVTTASILAWLQHKHEQQ